MRKTKVREVVLDLASEDFYGLWEILWRLNAICPNQEEGDRLEAARSAVAELVREGAVALYWRASATSEPVPIEVDPESVLAAFENWCEPGSLSQREVCVAVD